MGTRLDSFSFDSTPEYAWGEWLDGHAWRLVRGEDYTVQTTAVVTAGRDKAARLGGRLRSRRVADEQGREAVVIQFVPRDRL